MRINCFLTALCVSQTLAFTTTQVGWIARTRTFPSSLFAETTKVVTATPGFIETELRGAAMKLHTTRQAPREGQVVEKLPEKKYVPTHQDYLQFLVDSKHVYEALEEVVNSRDELAMFRKTGLERTQPLEQDIAFMAKEYNLKIPHVGKYGKAYAEQIRSTGSIPEFMCHYYNFYFAHTAGGRMIGKQMAALLLEKKTLEFYKWDGDLKEIKDRVKGNIEVMAAQWSREDKDQCVGGTAAAFQGGGGINAYLSGVNSGHSK